MSFVVFLLLLLLWPHKLVLGSQGDSQSVYIACRLGCESSPHVCNNTATTLLLFTWSCADECKYQCMHEIEAHNAGLRRALQYHGKWPFTRLLGVQEPLSALFSLLNAYPHAKWLLTPRLREMYAPKHDIDPAYRNLLLAASCVGVNTWWWSFVFHTRDMWWTERLDYHFATVHMATYFVLACVRVVLLLRPKQVRPALLGFSLFMLVVIAHHVWYLNFVHFDYGYNMLVTGIVVALQVCAWLVWAFAAKTKGAPHWQMICKFQALLVCFALLETFDFPPVFFGLLDAHACWHGLTIGLVFYWYRFLTEDAKWRNKTRF
jgi:hypothetical protein